MATSNKTIQGAPTDLSYGDRRSENDATTVQSDVDNIYDNNARQNDITEASNNQEAIMNNLTPDQFYKIYGYWDWNLAKNNPKGNLNNKNYANTLYNSRLTDAFNNRKYWKAARIGHRTNSGFGSTGIQQGQAYQMSPIETQETRQMRANEQLDMLARQGQQDLATRMQGYKFDVQQNADKIRQGISELIAKNKIDLRKHEQESIWDKRFNGSWEAYWQSQMAQFAKELDLNVKNRVLNTINSLEQPLASIYASLNGGEAPDFLTNLAYKYVNTALAGYEPGSEEYNSALLSSAGLLASLFGKATGEVLNGLLRGVNPFGWFTGD